jgi:predicted nuclease of restriction endonuclease-like (RecB) superfamily
VSESTHRYFAAEGVLRNVSPDDPKDVWYFRVRDARGPYDVNLDWDERATKVVTEFINFRVIDSVRRTHIAAMPTPRHRLGNNRRMNRAALAKKSVPRRGGRGSSVRGDDTVDVAFGEVVDLIRSARQRVTQVANAEVIDLYWRIGLYLHRRIEADGWAKGTVVQLAAYIAQREPSRRGFSAQNLWRMRQFFQAYPAARTTGPGLSSLLREVPWSSHLHILSRAKRREEREFYLRLAAQQRWKVREVARQIDSGLYERALLDPPKVSTALRESQPHAAHHFRTPISWSSWCCQIRTPKPTCIAACS